METGCDFERELTPDERRVIERARRKAYILYAGEVVAHRSCGIALAETFNLPPRPYQALRRGGLTGEGECGAIKAGELVLGEYLGSPDPTAPATQEHRGAAQFYRRRWQERIDRGEGGRSGSIICNDLTRPFASFQGQERLSFCTHIAAEVAAVVAETLLRAGTKVDITSIHGIIEGDGA